MIITTTPYIENSTIMEYKGIVFGEVVAGVNMFRDFGAGIRNAIGGRAGGYEKELMKARDRALTEMEQRASQFGANAIVGVDIDYEVLGTDSNMLMVTTSGTAVVIQ